MGEGAWRTGESSLAPASTPPVEAVPPAGSPAETSSSGTPGALVIDLRFSDPRTYEVSLSDEPIESATPTPEDRLRDGLAVMAHEVRGPLLAARAAIERAMLDRDLGVDGSLLLGKACREIDRVSRHVNRLLRWGARLQDVSIRPADLVGLVDEAVESCVFETGQDRVRVVRGARPVVDADPDHLRMAIANLVRNALQYSPSDTDVDVSIEIEAELAIITVTDRGPGILDEERHAIFDPFVRGTAGLRTVGGGIGLFFARSVIDALGGSVRCESNGSGTSFHVWLPVSCQEVSSSAS